MLHKTRVTRAVTALGLHRVPERSPLVGLLYTLADQMDAAGKDPSARLVGAYLSALKDLDRSVIRNQPKVPEKTNDLAAFRAKKNAG